VTLPIVMTVAGSDPSGGAGIQADLKTFAALQVYGAAAITAVTVQNTTGVTDVVLLDAALIAAQMRAVLSDIDVDVVKLGMLGSADIVRAVGDAIPASMRVVLDPVMVAKSGARLLSDDAVRAVLALLPRTTVVTPNAPEAEVLLGWDVGSIHDVKTQIGAGQALLALGSLAVLVKGGHVTGGGGVTDVLVTRDGIALLATPRIDTRHTHGTGCTLASAIAAHLARGDDVTAAVRGAQAYVHRAIREAPGIGAGRGPLGHHAFGRKP
jgi:hydroxymethylpyrimidine/phosphomethylpyrimidine kinase